MSQLINLVFKSWTRNILNCVLKVAYFNSENVLDVKKCERWILNN